MSRHSQATPNQIEALKRDLAAGVSVTAFARERGLPRSTVADWVRRIPPLRAAAAARPKSAKRQPAPPSPAVLAWDNDSVVVSRWWFDGVLERLKNAGAHLDDYAALAAEIIACPRCVACDHAPAPVTP